MQPKILIIGTGGTIAGMADDAEKPGQYRAAQLSIAALLAGVSGIETAAAGPLDAVQIAQIDSKDMNDEVWHALLKRCDARYPLARGTAPVKLPSDPFQRDLLCVGASSYVMGIFQGATLPDLAKPYERLQLAYLERVPDSMFAQQGLTDENRVKEAMDGSLRNSLRIGNLDGITKACEQALKVK